MTTKKELYTWLYYAYFLKTSVIQKRQKQICSMLLIRHKSNSKESAKRCRYNSPTNEDANKRFSSKTPSVGDKKADSRQAKRSLVNKPHLLQETNQKHSFIHATNAVLKIHMH